MKIEDFSAFAKMSDEERTAEFAKMSDEDITASIADGTTKATAIFATEAKDRTVALANEASDTVVSLGLLEAEETARTAAAQDAADRFAAAQAKFAGEDADGDDAEDDADDDSEDEDGDDDADEDEDEDAEDGDDSEDEGEVEAAAKKKGKNPFVDKDKEDDTVTAANPLLSRRLPAARTSAARKVGAKTKRRDVAASNAITITAAANVEGFGAGHPIEGMTKVAEAVLSVAKNLPRFNRDGARFVREETGGKPKIHKTSTASFNIATDAAVTASSKKGDMAKDHDAVQAALRGHAERVGLKMRGGTDAAVTAAMAWCTPSEVSYNWIADFVIDGLLSTPEVPAPRGGLMMTEGPRLLQGTYDDSEVGIDETSYDDADEPYGFGGTEEEMEAGYIKECETIECPEWADHRLDFTGYCWKIPLLTEATFPELVADAMRVADVAFAHKMNRRKIGDILRGSTAIDATNALGGSMLDTLEAFTQVAIKERRWWNIGENATMEVKLPQVARYIFQFDMARRSGLALSDTATEQKVNAHFAAYNLQVEYLSDFDQVYGAATPTTEWPDTIRGIMYPVGTWLTSTKPVVNLSTIYDAASLSENEYTGVFFEQGLMTFRRGYRSHKITVPVCVSGTMGANAFQCENPLIGVGSF